MPSERHVPACDAGLLFSGVHSIRQGCVLVPTSQTLGSPLTITDVSIAVPS